MSRRQSAFAYAALLLGVISFASSFARPSAGQQDVPAPAPAAVGRFQVTAAGANSPLVFVTDTVTGHTWGRWASGSNNWIDYGTPPKAK